MTEKYKTVKVNSEIITIAKKKGLSVNELYYHQKSLLDLELTTEQKEILDRLKITEQIVFNLTEALKHQRYLTDNQSKKIDTLNETVSKLIDMQKTILNAYSADIAFIQALKKEITQ